MSSTETERRIASPAPGAPVCGAVSPLRASVAPGIANPEVDLAEHVDIEAEVPWLTIVWNDPVNLMTYVTYVFRTYFGYSKAKATKLMLDVHHKGRAVVASGPREQMERHVEALQGYGLWATFQKDD